jgi:hypothetical protein
MSTDDRGPAESDTTLGKSGNVASLFHSRHPDKDHSATATANGANAQPDPLRELVGSLERWDSHFTDSIRDVERRLIGVGDKVRKHDELFPVVKQNFQSLQLSLNGHHDRLGQLALRLDAHTEQLASFENGKTATDKEITALRADIDAITRKRAWSLWLAILALLGLAVSVAIQLGVVQVAAGLLRLIDIS